MKIKSYLLFVVVALLCLYSSSLFSQSATAIWSNTGSVAGTTPNISGSITAPAQVMRGLGVNQYTGTSTSQRLYSLGSGTGYWPADLIQSPVRYVEYSVAPQINTNLVVDTISMNLGDNIGNQTMRVNIYYYVGIDADTIDFFTKATKLSPDTQYCRILNVEQIPTYSRNIAVANGQKLYVRVYPFYTVGAASGKYIYIYNVKVIGKTTDIPVSASALWPLHTNGAATISGLLNGNAIKFDGTDLYHYGYNEYGDRWTTTLPSKGAWPAETTPNFSRYAQFSVGPQTGGTFYATALSFNMMYEFSTTLRAAVYYSNDSAFVKKTFVADTAVPAAKTAFSYVLRDTVTSGQMIYVRVYPYNLAADPSWKLVDVDSFKIAGVTTGLTILPPTVTTTSASYISTSFCTSGGNVSADGGGSVSARGVCWDTLSVPTIAKGKTMDGTGIGSFTSSVTGLVPGKTYYLRAYATNIGGTNYGNEIVLTTLTAVVRPTVTTTTMSSVMVSTAISGGSVTDWGGDTVTARGVCWNKDTTTSLPTIANSKTVDGAGLGSFTSGLTGLTASTKYFIRAYAANSAGTNYGNLIIFTTQTPQRDTTVVVAKDGSGNYTTVQAAFNAVPTNYTGTWKIFVKKGKYHEKDTLAAGKVNVVLEGELRDSTVIWNDDFSDKYGSNNPGTSGTFTITLNADDFIAKNITFENTYWPNRYGTVGGTQGVAVSANGDRQQFINCAFNGYQDTYYTRGSTATGRTYHKNCIFKGTVDYIFGRNICVFDSCTFVTIRSGGTITAGATEPTSLFGYVFRNCKLLGDTIASTDSTGWVRSAFTSANGYYLGRPWQGGPRTVFLHCYESANLNPAGWTTMQVNPTLYAEYNCYGPGFTSSRATISSWPTANQARQLTYSEAATYSLSTIFSRSSASSALITYDWMPTYAGTADNMPFVVSVEQEIQSGSVPREYVLHQNYPNPFNPSTTIIYDLPKSGKVSLKVYDLFGREIAVLTSGMKNAGSHREVFDGSGLASGVYFARLKTDAMSSTIKLLMMK